MSKIYVCCLSHPIHSILLYQPKQTNNLEYNIRFYNIFTSLNIFLIHITSTDLFFFSSTGFKSLVLQHNWVFHFQNSLQGYVDCKESTFLKKITPSCISFNPLTFLWSSHFEQHSDICDLILKCYFLLHVNKHKLSCGSGLPLLLKRSYWKNCHRWKMYL